MDLIILNDGLYQLIPVTTKILEVIERIRNDVKKCGEDNKNKTMKYLQNLTKISDLYFSN